MLHGDGQYAPEMLPDVLRPLVEDDADMVNASRMIARRGALAGGMPLYKYVSNRVLTCFENMLLGQKLSEYHTGYRAFSRELLEKLPLSGNSDDFIFDNEMLAQIAWTGAVIAEVSCPTKYFEEASSISFRRSLRYGFGCLGISFRYFLARTGLCSWRLLDGIRRNELEPDFLAGNDLSES